MVVVPVPLKLSVREVPLLPMVTLFRVNPPVRLFVRSGEAEMLSVPLIVSEPLPVKRVLLSRRKLLATVRVVSDWKVPPLALLVTPPVPNALSWPIRIPSVLPNAIVVPPV